PGRRLLLDHDPDVRHRAAQLGRERLDGLLGPSLELGVRQHSWTVAAGMLDIRSATEAAEPWVFAAPLRHLVDGVPGARPARDREPRRPGPSGRAQAPGAARDPPALR